MGVFQTFVGLLGLKAFVHAIGPFQSVWLTCISHVRLFVRSFVHMLHVQSPCIR